HAQPLLARGAGVGAQQGLTLPGGTGLGFYLIQNGSRAGWAARNHRNLPGRRPLVFFSFTAANPDGTAHVHSRAVAGGGLRWSWEDATGGGDRDFNDLIFTVRPGQPLPVPTPPVPTPPVVLTVVSPPDQIAPVIAAGLVNDTGLSPGDRVTSDPTV